MFGLNSRASFSVLKWRELSTPWLPDPSQSGWGRLLCSRISGRYQQTSVWVCCFPPCTGFPGGSEGKKICLQCGRPRFNPWVREIPLEKGMASHSSILAWRLSWTEEPGGLQSRGSQRVRHDWVNEHTQEVLGALRSSVLLPLSHSEKMPLGFSDKF